MLAIGEDDHVNLRLDIDPLQITQGRNLNLVVKMADVADNAHILHGHIATAADHSCFARHHHIGATADTINERFLAAIFVFEFRFGDTVIDIDGWKRQKSFFLQLVKPVDTGGCLFRDTPDGSALTGEETRRLLHALSDLRKHDGLFFRWRAGEHILAAFCLCPEQDIGGGIAIVIKMASV